MGCVADVGDQATPNVQIDIETPNGKSLNGTSLNGKSLNGISLNGISLNGKSLNGVSLNGSQLIASSLSGSAVVGATMSGTLEDGTAISLRIDGAAPLAAPNADVWSYSVSYSQGSAWQPLCGSGVGAEALAGTWNYGSGVVGGGSWTASATQFTFGCRGTALAKCVELGYKPWLTVNGTSLRNYHQACTRMLRADYCGDGTPHTFNGWELDVFDAQSIQTATPGLNWDFEAHWSGAGAMCMSGARALDLIVEGDVPTCIAQRLGTACAVGNFSDGSVMQDYFDPWSLSAALNAAYTQYPNAQVQLQTAITDVTNAVNYLAATPPDPLDAAAQVALALTQITAAVPKGVPPSFAQPLELRYTQLVRSSVTTAIAAATAAKAPAAKLTCANNALAAGDSNAASMLCPGAVIQYRNALTCLK
ncbi:MAG TPA: ADYC domain-containing protein [Kofleriaceae bacterium]